MPYLRSAVLRMGSGDGESFWTFSAMLGEQLATAEVPFSVFVAHLGLLRESCLTLLAAHIGEIGRTTRLTIDKLTACCVSAAADGYYRCANGAPHAAASVSAGRHREPAAVPPM